MTAPSWNSVDVFRGEVEKRPSKFWPALSEADSICRELDGLHETQTRIQELTAENTELHAYIDALIAEKGALVDKLQLSRADADDAAETIGLLIAERDQLEDDLVGARDSLAVWKQRALAKAGAS